MDLLEGCPLRYPLVPVQQHILVRAPARGLSSNIYRPADCFAPEFVRGRSLLSTQIHRAVAMARLGAGSLRLFATLLAVGLASRGAAAAVPIPSILTTSDGGVITVTLCGLCARYAGAYASCTCLREHAWHAEHDNVSDIAIVAMRPLDASRCWPCAVH